MGKQEVYMKDDGEKILVINAETDKELYRFTYVLDGAKIWDRDDAFRTLRRTHFGQDFLKEVFKCKCNKILRLPKKTEVKVNDDNLFECELKCECDNVIIIQSNTLKIKELK